MSETKSMHTAVINSARRFISSAANRKSHGVNKTTFEFGREKQNVVTFLVQTVTSPTVKTRTIPLKDDLSAIRKAAQVILSAVDDGTLTEKEGSVVISLLSEQFAIRRFDSIFQHISDTQKAGWFLAASRTSDER